MSSMSGVSVRTCRWSMRMSPQHFFAKDRYLWTMLCLCCKLALPTTRKNVNWFPFLMYHKCKPDSSGLNIIADTTLYEISSCSVLYLYFPDLHCQFWYFNSIFLYSFFLLLSYLIFYFTQAVKTILHFNPEREHLDSEEATVFFFLLSQLKIKLLLLKQPNCVCSLMNIFVSCSSISLTKTATVLSLLFYICTTEAHRVWQLQLYVQTLPHSLTSHMKST